ncbi:YitT family protein [Halarcobacter bivalviorum]|uniref:YitT family protein n=1 Tax=Halarcobacter bivalviorum TaxID=663364 RepID=UPI00100C2406|nr:YitT family protein [Halarcobacter bivalviorum]RXK07100.1 membrane protein [Halarcobacter bivalviorum]
MSTIFNKNELKNIFYILLGTICISISVVLFFIPHNFTTGGTPGAAILLHKLSDFSVGTMVIAINLPLLIWGMKYFGKLFALKTVITVALISIFIDFFSYTLNFDLLISNILVAAIFGGVIIGFGVGFIIKGNSSAGGSTIIAKIIASNSHIKPAQVILISDIIIVVSSIYVFKDFEKAVLSIMSIYTTAKAIDIVLTGTLTTKVIHITTSKPQELGEQITKRLGHEGTLIQGDALNKQDDKTLIFMVIDVKKLGELREIIEQTDKDAFMIVMEASEMLGRGH